MENSVLVDKILTLKREKAIRLIGHSYTPEEVQPVADSLADSRKFFEGIMQLPDDERDVMVLGPTFFAETARVLLFGRNMRVLSPVLAECPVASHRHLTFEHVGAFKRAHPGVPMVCYAVAPLEAKLLADFVALPGEVVSTIDRVAGPEVLFVGDGNCALRAIQKCKKKVIVYPRNPVCNVYNSITISDVERARKTHPEACILIHSESRTEVVERADYAVGTGEMANLIAKLNHKTFVIGSEIGFYHRMVREFPDKQFVHLSPRLVCNAFKAIRLENVLESLEQEKEVVRVDDSVARPLYQAMKKKS